MNRKVTVLTRRVGSKILVMRNRRVILDSDLAELYGVEVKRLNQQVKRNAERFPVDFVFRIRESYSGAGRITTTPTPSRKHWGRKTRPWSWLPAPPTKSPLQRPCDCSRCCKTYLTA